MHTDGYCVDGHTNGHHAERQSGTQTEAGPDSGVLLMLFVAAAAVFVDND